MPRETPSQPIIKLNPLPLTAGYNWGVRYELFETLTGQVWPGQDDLSAFRDAQGRSRLPLSAAGAPPHAAAPRPLSSELAFQLGYQEPSMTISKLANVGIPLLDVPD